MCGLTGFYILDKKFNTNILQDKLTEMTKSIEHRGPDFLNIWLSEFKNVGLGHTRLKIRDLSDNGNQPMTSSCGNFKIIYNGEIYNEEYLKKKLSIVKNNFKSTSDTEIILECFSYFGIKKTLIDLEGMFALAIFDLKSNKLFISRDRMGIKPMYYNYSNNIFTFGSEIKSLKNLNFENEIDLDAVNYFLKYGQIPAPLSIYKNIKKVLPGEIISIDINNKIEKIRYWKLENEIKQNNSDYSDLKNNVSKLDKLINESVNKHLISDVEIGAFLSGGMDSSLTTYYMQKNFNKKVKTFSVGFKEKEFDESNEARKISNFLKTEHHELIMSDKEILESFDKIIQTYDEPFADPSQIPTLYVCKEAKKKVKVVISGDGGDELFGGYLRYTDLNYYTEKKINFKIILKIFIAKINKIIPKQVLRFFQKILNLKFDLNERILSYEKFFKVSDKEKYLNLLSQNDLNNVLNYKYHTKIDNFDSFNPNLGSLKEKYMFLDTTNYLPNMILTKVDRASMAYGLEVRVPLLDNSLINFSWKLPIHNKIIDKDQKIILRELINKNFPKDLINKNKKGFGIPLDKWLRTVLLGRVDKILTFEKLEKHKIFNSNKIIKMWHDHKNNKKNFGNQLWNVIILQLWLDKNV